MLSLLEAYFSKLSGAHRLLAFVLVVAVSTTLVAFLAGGWTTGVPVGILVLAILWITGPLWKPASHEGKLKVRLTSLTVISGVALAVAGKTPEAKPILHFLLDHLGLAQESAQQVIGSDRLVSGLVLAFTLVGVAVVNWFTRDRSAMQRHPKPLDKDFPEQTYREQLRRFGGLLMTRLNTLDDETRWDDYFFAPLEAEVEVVSGRRLTKRIVDLMGALRADRTSRTMLVIGDPGAGKSIALRKLAKELMNEVEGTDRLPVYVNLKEWGVERQWTEDAPPNVREFRAFILRTLTGSSLFADRFLGKYFDRMLDRGRFFFLLDSFDEIPAVLDVSEDSWLIQHLSHLISDFFASQLSGRGVVASRFYRKPRFGRMESATFEIRPFSDMRIHETLSRSDKLSPDTIDKLFRDRTELIPVARNPFSAALIRIYAETFGGELPSNQLEMYESYIRGRLEASNEKIRQHGLTLDEVVEGATEIAWCMFREAEIGLEAPVKQLGSLLPNAPIEGVTTILRYSGLGRMSGSTEPRFSFVHRRLNEYFVARGLLKDPGKVDLQAIPTDSRYRDALALYCEVGDVEHVKKIATFCWLEIAGARVSSASKPVDRLRAVHCLRFLRDAFRSRPDCLEFVTDLADYIGRRLDATGDLLEAKIALEATGLLPEEQAQPILVKALEMGNAWISETALHACRHLKRVGPKLDEGLFEYLGSMSVREFLHRRREFIFSLSLSDAFRGLRRYCLMRSLDNRAFLVAVVCSGLVFPLGTLAIAALWMLSSIQLRSGRARIRKEWRNRTLMRTYLAALVIVQTYAANFRPLQRVAPPSWANWLGLSHTWHGPIASISGAVSRLMALGLWQGVRLRSLGPACLFVGLALAPAIDFAFYIRRMSWRSLFSLDRLKPLLLSGFATLIVFVIVNKLTDLFRTWFERHWIVVLVLFSLPIVLLLASGLRFLWQYYWDAKQLREVTRSTALTRHRIAADFRRFRTAWYRRRYVQWLRDTQVQPIGDWSGPRPNVDSDAASTMLAQLDERWLSLES